SLLLKSERTTKDNAEPTSPLRWILLSRCCKLSAIWLTFVDLSYLPNNADLLNVEMILKRGAKIQFCFWKFIKNYNPIALFCLKKVTGLQVFLELVN
ncbi:MAG: hypothetical protein ABWZ56_00360, partial [Flavobacterium sp.]